ncbi:MAG TPA: FAD-dependent oxidoreductase [Steroidobacteraceae bacterium]|nr:FAD-dependent oxidoreductase [Steroidobacteraceae bacterium]
MTDRRKRPSPARGLGADRSIPRRDFLQGTLVAAATTLAGPLLKAYAGVGAAVAPQDAPGYYPPALTGLRGSHPGSFEDAHALRDGRQSPAPVDTGETYDLVVVGAGISGLSAAHFFRARTSPGSRVLLLDNHDDFGGHAKRNEFQLGGRLHLMNGGTLEIDSPRPYAPVPAALIRELGIDVEALSRRVEHLKFYEDLGLRTGVFLDRETFGADRLLVGFGKLPMKQLLADSPLSARARADIERIEEGEVDYLPGRSSAAKKDALSRISYSDFLRNLVKADPAVVAFYQSRTHGEWGVGIDAVSALDCWGFGLSGFRGMKLEKGSISRMGYTPSGYEDTGGSATLHFPDGNATIARLLVRSLIPDALPGQSVDDIVSARADYSRLDRAASNVRIRLSSTVIRARNSGGDRGSVEVTYLRGGQPYTVRARNCVLACWNMMIPYLCPELPETQKQALHKLVKTPLVYTSVALRNWESFAHLKVHRVYAPSGYHSSFSLNPKVDIGAYRSSTVPSEPILVHMTRTPCKPGLPEHEQNKAGRAELLATPFATFEQNIREQLARSLAGGGFDPARDIQGITVNRWPHGYAPEFNPLFEPDVPEAQRPNVIGRARLGRIAIANSDSGAAAYTDSAILQADRAVRELLAG